MKRNTLTFAFILISSLVVFTQNDQLVTYAREHIPVKGQLESSTHFSFMSTTDPGIIPSSSSEVNPILSADHMPDNPAIFRTDNNVPVKLHTVLTPRGYVKIWMPEENQGQKKNFDFKGLFNWFDEKVFHPKKCPTF